MKSKIIFTLIGVIIGVVSCCVFNYYGRSNEYYTLCKDYNIEDVGTIKKGTIIKFDKPFSEGFNRFVIYINISDAEDLIPYKTDKNNLIIPYWLRNPEEE